MDFQMNNPHPELGKLEQIVSQFLLKSLHIILDSRIPSLRPSDHSGDLSSGFHVKRSDKWFNLVLGDRPAALDNLNFWHRNLMDPLVIDIILVHQGPDLDNLYSDSAVAGGSVETVLERWVVQYETPLIRPHSHQTSESSTAYKKTYKKSIILLRSIYSHMRLLPAHRIFRQFGSSAQCYNFDIQYKVSSISEPFSRSKEAMMQEYSFIPVDALPGRLCASVTYRPTLSDINLGPSVSLPPRIISDYVGSPATDPMRYVPSSLKGPIATSFPARGFLPPLSLPSHRPHSWTSGFHPAAPFMQNQSVGGSPPVYRTSTIPYDYPSPPADAYGVRIQTHRPPARYKATSYDDYQPSPPFSASASPSPPTYFSNNSPLHSSNRTETAPVTIPHSLSGRYSRNLSFNLSDPNRSSLPPLSPRSSKNDPSSQDSPSGLRLYKKTEASRAADLNTGVTNPSSVQKIVRDSRDDSGRFSGLLSSSGSPRIGFSRSSSRLSLQDDLDDCDFSCPFDVDDVDTADYPARQKFDGKKGSETGSQDAAVGMLVHMLRTAPPLRQDSSCYSSHSLRPELDGVVTASGFFMPRKTSDALEELRSYREMKDLLLSKSGNRVISKDEA